MFPAGVVSDLCVALGEFIDADPKGASAVAHKLGAVLLRQQERQDERSAELAEEAKLHAGRLHEMQQRSFDLREREVELEGERVKVEQLEAAAAGDRR